MKQTLEEAARKYADEIYDPADRGILYRETQDDFIAGAKWHARQPLWISVEERLPEYNTEVIIYHEYRFYVGFMYYSMKSNWWRVSEDERTDMIVNEDDFWTPIPSFDEILEANRDVLERIKEERRLKHEDKKCRAA